MIGIYKLRPEHLQHLKMFFEAINTPAYINDFSPFPFDAQSATNICHSEGEDLYYAMMRDDGEIIGIGMLRGWDEGYETPSLGLCIREKYQDMGFGKLMLTFLEVVARAKGSLKIMLKVKKSNEKAKTLYEASHYIFSKHRDGFLIGYKDILLRRNNKTG